MQTVNVLPWEIENLQEKIYAQLQELANDLAVGKVDRKRDHNGKETPSLPLLHRHLAELKQQKFTRRDDTDPDIVLHTIDIPLASEGRSSRSTVKSGH